MLRKVCSWPSMYYSSGSGYRSSPKGSNPRGIWIGGVAALPCTATTSIPYSHTMGATTHCRTRSSSLGVSLVGTAVYRRMPCPMTRFNTMMTCCSPLKMKLTNQVSLFVHVVSLLSFMPTQCLTISPNSFLFLDSHLCLFEKTALTSQ